MRRIAHPNPVPKNIQLAPDAPKRHNIVKDEIEEQSFRTKTQPCVRVI